MDLFSIMIGKKLAGGGGGGSGGDCLVEIEPDTLTGTTATISTPSTEITDV